MSNSGPLSPAHRSPLRSLFKPMSSYTNQKWWTPDTVAVVTGSECLHSTTAHTLPCYSHRAYCQASLAYVFATVPACVLPQRTRALARRLYSSWPGSSLQWWLLHAMVRAHVTCTQALAIATLLHGNTASAHCVFCADQSVRVQNKQARRQ